MDITISLISVQHGMRLQLILKITPGNYVTLFGNYVTCPGNYVT